MDWDRELRELLQYADQFANWLAQDGKRWEEIAPHLIIVNQASKERDVLVWTQGYQSALVLQSVAAHACFPKMSTLLERAVHRFAFLLQATGVSVN